jgi:hypothetical protein
MKHERNFDIARSIRAIEGLKVDLLGAVTGLFRSLQGGADGDALVETLAQVIFCAWRLAGRLGVSRSGSTRGWTESSRRFGLGNRGGGSRIGGYPEGIIHSMRE